MSFIKNLAPLSGIGLASRLFKDKEKDKPRSSFITEGYSSEGGGGDNSLIGRARNR